MFERSSVNDPIKFCHISPTPHLEEYTKHNGAHLLLAHLVEQDPDYMEFYANLDDGRAKIMDNSAFEMFKQGRPMYDSNKLIEMGKACKADVIVMSDYPKEPWTKTRDAAINMIPALKDAGFGTFYVPQSNLSDIDGALKSFDWALGNSEVDLIGVSILTCPIAFGVDESSYGEGKRNDAYKMQRFLSRWKMFIELDRAGLLSAHAIKRFHCLGMTDGPNEIELLTSCGFGKYIYSWDSSAAVWAGLNGIQFDGSPSGLRNGKFEHEVDFDFKGEHLGTTNLQVINNINYINKLCSK
jgi:hypothetical protein